MSGPSGQISLFYNSCTASKYEGDGVTEMLVFRLESDLFLKTCCRCIPIQSQEKSISHLRDLSP